MLKQLKPVNRTSWTLRLAFCLLLVSGVSHALNHGTLFGQSTAKVAQLKDISQFGNAGQEDEAGPLTVSAKILATTPDKPLLAIAVEIKPGWHIYSITQPAGGPVASKITLDPSDQYKIEGKFTSDPKPDKKKEPAFKNLVVESHEEKVTWQGTIVLSPGVKASDLKISGKVRIQACDEKSCLPPKNYPIQIGAAKGDAKKTSAQTDKDSAPPSPDQEKATPAFTLEHENEIKSPPPADEANSAPPAQAAASNDKPSVKPAIIPVSQKSPAPASSLGEFNKPNSQVIFRGHLEPSSVKPGGEAKLIISAEPAKEWHIYAVADGPQIGIAKPTKINLELPEGWKAGPPQADIEFHETKNTKTDGTPTVDRYYDKQVTWTIPISIPADAPEGEQSIEGGIAYQLCREANCLRPTGVQFEVALKIGDQENPPSEKNQTPVSFIGKTTSYAIAAGEESAKTPAQSGDSPPVARDVPKMTFTPIEFGGDRTKASNIVLLGFACLGGFILNFMPCVLPVIGLKVLAFVEQSKHDRKQVLLLNLWYSAGIISVFLILATLAAFSKYSWGQQFRDDRFNIILTSVVFVMSLSFLGIWEIPIPGFVGGATASGAASKEGAIGAFSKGIITTILATPCSGPFLGSTFAIVLKQPTWMIYAIFFSIGLGMAIPYLLIGAFPRLIKLLPKPGAWMDTFKHIMGFVLLLTVVFLYSAIKDYNKVPAFALLIGLWAGCWWIGRTPFTASMKQKIGAWMTAGVVATGIGFLGFALFGVHEELIKWQQYSSRSDLISMLAKKQMVLIDFTGDS